MRFVSQSENIVTASLCYGTIGHNSHNAIRMGVLLLGLHAVPIIDGLYSDRTSKPARGCRGLPYMVRHAALVVMHYGILYCTMIRSGRNAGSASQLQFHLNRIIPLLWIFICARAAVKTRDRLSAAQCPVYPSIAEVSS